MTVTYIRASGDATGATDSAAFTAAFAAGDTVVFTGTCVTNATIAIATGQSLYGVGYGESILEPVNNTFAAVTVGDPSTRAFDVTLSGFYVEGGLYGLHIAGGSLINVTNCKFAHAESHGIYCSGGVWEINLLGSEVWGAGQGGTGDGINSVTVSGYQNGNRFTIAGGSLRTNADAGIRWAANTLSITGVTVENNGAYGVHCQSTANAQCRAMHICGNHFEDNTTGQIALTGVTGKTCQGIHISGNLLSHVGVADDGHIACLGDADTVRELHVLGNDFSTGPTYNIWSDTALQWGVLHCDPDLIYEGATSLALAIDQNGAISFPFNSAIGCHWGRPGTNGSWRLCPSGTGMVFARRESDSWVTKSTLSDAGVWT